MPSQVGALLATSLCCVIVIHCEIPSTNSEVRFVERRPIINEFAFVSQVPTEAIGWFSFCSIILVLCIYSSLNIFLMFRQNIIFKLSKRMKPANLFNNSFKRGTPKWHYILSSLNHVKEPKSTWLILKDERVLGD